MNCLIAVLLIAVTNVAVADEPAKEFWPESDIWMRLTPAWRLSTFISFSKNIETKYREGNVLVQGDYAWGKTTFLQYSRLLDEGRAQEMKAWLVRGGYLYGSSLGDQGQNYGENAMFAEIHLRTPLIYKMLLSQRIRSDFRWLGDDPEFSMRLRYRLMLEIELTAGSTSIVPYLNAEPYYDSRYSTINRIRLIGGASVSWMTLFALEGNFTYQHDTRSSVTNLYALNIILHLFFDTGSDY